MTSIEDAYKSIADELLDFVQDNDWDLAETQIAIFEKMTQSDYARHKGGTVVRNDHIPSLHRASAASRAALYLRDDLLKSTGQRIWGLTFILHPTGKFNIEYDYNKPEEYEETDELIQTDEALREIKLESRFSDTGDSK